MLYNSLQCLLGSRNTITGGQLYYNVHNTDCDTATSPFDQSTILHESHRTASENFLQYARMNRSSVGHNEALNALDKGIRRPSTPQTYLFSAKPSLTVNYVPKITYQDMPGMKRPENAPPRRKKHSKDSELRKKTSSASIKGKMKRTRRRKVRKSGILEINL